MRFGPKFVGGSAVRPPDVDGCEMTCTGPITTTARTADSRTTSRRIAPPHAHFYNRDADVTRDSRATLPEAKRRSQVTNRDVALGRHSISAITRAGADSVFHFAGRAITLTLDGMSCRFVRYSIWYTTFACGERSEAENRCAARM